MVKQKDVVRTVTLDPAEPLARQYEWGDPTRSDTVPDAAPGLQTMIENSRAADIQLLKSDAYKYPDLGDDDEAHEHPDYSKIGSLDPAEKTEILENIEKFGVDLVELKKKQDAEAAAAAEAAKGGSNG